jgi:FlaA1/EpsC-like NDP-sugar epimerase
MLRRICTQLSVLYREVRILILGAAHSAEMIARQMRSDPGKKYQPIGLLDVNPAHRADAHPASAKNTPFA